MLTSIPASVTRLLAGDACLDADRRPGMFLGATLLERSAVADNSTSRFTVAPRNVLAVDCLPGGAAGPPIWEMSVYSLRPFLNRSSQPHLGGCFVRAEDRTLRLRSALPMGLSSYRGHDGPCNK